MFESIQEVNGKIVENQWIEWDHFGVPNSPKPYRDFIRLALSFLRHCTSCTALDGCYFVERNMPKHPLHERCDCNKFKISFSTVKSNSAAICPIEKFTNYIFTNDLKSKGKKKIFESLGFSYNDSQKLKLEYEAQCLKNYLQGNYLLKSLDGNGQRLAIPITINKKTFYTGWLLEPEGKIRNVTPFGGWEK